MQERVEHRYPVLFFFFNFPRWFQRAHKFRNTQSTTTFKRFRKAEDADWQSLVAYDYVSIHSMLWFFLGLKFMPNTHHFKVPQSYHDTPVQSALEDDQSSSWPESLRLSVLKPRQSGSNWMAGHTSIAFPPSARRVMFLWVLFLKCILSVNTYASLKLMT